MQGYESRFVSATVLLVIWLQQKQNVDQQAHFSKGLDQALQQPQRTHHRKGNLTLCYHPDLSAVTTHGGPLFMHRDCTLEQLKDTVPNLKLLSKRMAFWSNRSSSLLRLLSRNGTKRSPAVTRILTVSYVNPTAYLPRDHTYNLPISMQ